MRVGIVIIGIAAIVAALVVGVLNLQGVKADEPSYPDYEAVNSHVDDRFDWVYISLADINVYWEPGTLHENPESEEILARYYLYLAFNARHKAQLLLDTELDRQVHIYIYGDQPSMAEFFQGEGSDGVDTQHIEGLAINWDTVLLYNGSYLTDLIRHEVTHLVLFEALYQEDPEGWPYYHKAPFWLQEGIAQWSEYSYVYWDFSLASYREWLDAEGYAPPVCAMVGFPQDVDAQWNFYGKSLVLTNFLIQQKGIEGFSDFIGRLQRGWAVRYAMNATYGFTDHELEERWLSLVGVDQEAERCTY